MILQKSIIPMALRAYPKKWEKIMRNSSKIYLLLTRFYLIINWNKNTIKWESRNIRLRDKWGIKIKLGNTKQNRKTKILIKDQILYNIIIFIISIKTSRNKTSRTSRQKNLNNRKIKINKKNLRIVNRIKITLKIRIRINKNSSNKEIKKDFIIASLNHKKLKLIIVKRHWSFISHQSTVPQKLLITTHPNWLQLW